MRSTYYRKKNIVWIIGFIWLIIAALLVWKFFSFVHLPSGILTTSKQSNMLTKSPTPTPQPSTRYPSQILSLTDWKITLPIQTDSNGTNPVEIKQPNLATYSIYPWFFARSDQAAVIFRAPVNGVTTSGSNYPRSELREMINNGADQASWSSAVGIHSMFIDESITAVPKTKPQVVAGQIHDASSDVIVIRLNYPTLFVNVDGNNVHALDTHYTLGKRFSVKFVVQNNTTNIYYNGSKNPVYTLKKEFEDSYFKAGVYTQSNCSTEKNSNLCNSNNYGEVTIYQLDVNHQ